MPQNSSKHSNKPRNTTKGSNSSTATAANETSSTWQRGQGAFSGKAKKDYLKWKRQQKAAAASTDDDSDWLPEASPGTATNPATQDSAAGCNSMHPTLTSPAAEPEAASAVAIGRTWAAHTADDPSAPLQYRPLVAVTAAPFDARLVQGSSAAAGLKPPQQPGHADAANTAASTAAISVSPCDATARSAKSSPAAELHPQQQPGQADEPQTESTATTAASCTAAAVDSCGVQAVEGIMYMPILDPAEVGFTAEGFELGMPTRPRWQGVVRNAEQLHALEERQFAAWQKSLLQKAQLPRTDTSDPTTAVEGLPQEQQSGRAGGVGKLSFYEGRLEYWRQLWRTLEMSDVVIMIVDARNPLLHFSHALYRHITRDHKLPLMILLNKCDLIPAAAAAAWQQWLQQQLPGVRVVLASAADGQAAAAATSVVKELLSMAVERGGKAVTVQDFVDMSVEQLLDASYTRNIHAKRHVVPHQTAPPAAAAASEEEQCDSDDADALDDKDTGNDHESGDDSHDGDEGWSLQPSKVAKKAGKKAGLGRYRQQKQQKQQQQQQRGKATFRSGQSGRSRLAPPLAQAAAAIDQESAAATEIEEEIDPAATELTSRIESLTLEHRLSNSFSPEPQSTGICDTTAAAAAAGGLGGAATTAAAAEESSGCSSSSGSEGVELQDDRPIVVGLLGEPNVGKSSTLNSLLGAHRVAVSCHPGRTKHYQTHFMTDKLVLCDCPGIVFPRLDVSLPMQVLFGSYPIASCRQPYAVVRYLAEASWPRIHKKLGLKQQQQQQQDAAVATEQQTASSSLCTESKHLITATSDAQTQDSSSRSSNSNRSEPCGNGVEEQGEWSPWQLCESLAEKRRWVLPRSGRLDTYRAANWLLRAALGGREGLGLAFMPPETKHLGVLMETMTV